MPDLNPRESYGQLFFLDNTIESISPSIDIELGLTTSSANLKFNRNVVLAAGKSFGLVDSILGTPATLTSNNGTLVIAGATGLLVGDIKIFGDTIESSSLGTDIQLGNVAATANLKINRNLVLSSGKTITFADGSVQSSAAPKYFGSFYDTTTTTFSSATTAYPLPLNSTAESNGVTVVSGSRITVPHSGVYNIQFSIQLEKSDSGDDYVNIWLSKNGTNVPYSNSQVTVIGNNGKAVAAWNFMIYLVANDYVQIMAHSADTSMKALAAAAQTNPTRPAIPSVIVTVSEVS